MEIKLFEKAADDLYRQVPSELEVGLCSLCDLAAALEKFASEYFSGILQVETGFDAVEYVRLSPEGFIHLLKLLLREIHGRTEVSLRLSVSFPRAVIEIDGKGTSFVNDRLIRLAELSALKVIEQAEDRLLLEAEIAKNPALFVYAVSHEGFAKILRQVFFG